MTREELKKFNGKDGNPAYVACNGKVYDVTKSDFWSGGTHMGRFRAGEDLSSSIGLSPHGEGNLQRYPVVAELTEEASERETGRNNLGEDKMAGYRRLYVKLHPHPMMIHFPMGIFPFAFIMQILSLIAGGSSYLTFASVAAVTFATLFLLPALATGLLSFAVNYNFKANKYLKRKMILSALTLACGAWASFIGLRAMYYLTCPSAPAHAAVNPSVSPFYTVLTAVATLFIIGIGYNGGKLTWPSED